MDEKYDEIMSEIHGLENDLDKALKRLHKETGSVTVSLARSTW